MAATDQDEQLEYDVLVRRTLKVQNIDEIFIRSFSADNSSSSNSTGNRFEESSYAPIIGKPFWCWSNRIAHGAFLYY